MLFHTILLVVTSSIFAAPQYYYSNLNQDISSRLGRSTYKKCPNGFLMNAVKECVQPEIERFYFLFETPKVPIIQPQYSNQLANNVYESTSEIIPPFFFLVQPKVPQIPNSGVLPITSYPSGQYQVPNSLFLQQANGHLKKNSFTSNNLKQSSLLPLQYSKDDSISDSSHENELSFDYSRQYQPSSEYQQPNQNLFQENRKEIDNSVTRITSFRPPSGIKFHPSSTTGLRTVQTSLKQTNKNADISSVSADEIKSAGDLDKESALGNFDQQPPSALNHIDGRINSLPVEEARPISSAYKGSAANFFTLPGTRKQSNSVSRATHNKGGVNSILSSVGTLHSPNDENETEPVIVDDEESPEDSFGLRSDDENSSDKDGGNDDIASTGTINRPRTYQDQPAEKSVAAKNTANVYFFQSGVTSEAPEFRTSSAQSRGSFNSKNIELLGKAATGKNNKFSIGNLGLNDGGIHLNKMFDHIRANLTSGTSKPDSYKGFVYIVADEGKEIIYEF